MFCVLKEVLDSYLHMCLGRFGSCFSGPEGGPSRTPALLAASHLCPHLQQVKNACHEPDAVVIIPLTTTRG